MRRWSALAWIVGAWIGMADGPLLARAVTVSVDVTHGFRVDGTTEVESRVLGMTAYEGAPAPAAITGCG